MLRVLNTKLHISIDCAEADLRISSCNELRALQRLAETINSGTVLSTLFVCLFGGKVIFIKNIYVIMCLFLNEPILLF